MEMCTALIYLAVQIDSLLLVIFSLNAPETIPHPLLSVIIIIIIVVDIVIIIWTLQGYFKTTKTTISQLAPTLGAGAAFHCSRRLWAACTISTEHDCEQKVNESRRAEEALREGFAHPLRMRGSWTGAALEAVPDASELEVTG